MNNYSYEIINYWNDQDDLYVNYVVKNNENGERANAIQYFNVSDIGCNYNESSEEEIKKKLLDLLVKNDGREFSLPKVSELSPLLIYIYDFVCDSESNMCHIDYTDWDELTYEDEFFEEDVFTLKEEIEKFDLKDYITVDTPEYKICGYGGLQCCFNDDRERADEHER